MEISSNLKFSQKIDKIRALKNKNDQIWTQMNFQTKIKKSARFAGTFSLRASRSVILDRRAARSVLCSSHTFKFISYNLILKLKPI